MGYLLTSTFLSMDDMARQEPRPPSLTDQGTIPIDIPPIQYRRKIRGVSAAYLPFLSDGAIDFASYTTQLERIWSCGLSPAINMDTGFVNLLSRDQRDQVLVTASQQAVGRSFIAGAFVGDQAGDCTANYQRECESIANFGGQPILFQCDDLTKRDRRGIVDVYRQVGKACESFLAFELGQMFAPFGKIYDNETFRELLSIPSLVGIKHSSLSRSIEWDRLATRDAERPDFVIYTGNDLAIDMIQWGSDYLLGLSAFFPEAFARRDAYWLAGDARYFELNDALQFLGAFSFRPPVPAYKHNCAMALAYRGIIIHDSVHTNATPRPDSDRVVIHQTIDRINELLA